MEIKTTLKFYLTPVRMRKVKTQVTAGVGEDVEKEKHPSTAGGIARWYNHFGNQSVGSQKTGHDTSGGPCYSTPGHIPRGFPSMQ